jgi:hypothetical protein
MAITLLPHQTDALAKMRNGCILKGPTGSGKTVTALAYYTDAEPAERLVVITTAMKRDTGDWQAAAREMGLFPDVDSWHNLSSYEDITGAFFIFDEQRIVGSGAWVKSFLKITKNNHWVLLSATPGDTWLDYIPVFLANGFYKSRTEFCREHVVFARFVTYPKVERFTGTSRLARHLRDILVEMPYEKHTVRHEKDVFCSFDESLYNTAWRRRWNFIEERPVRHVSELFSLIRRVVNADPSRLAGVREIMLAHPKVIIFYNFDYELEILRELDTLTAERNGHKHEEIPEKEFGRWAYLVQYASGAEGWGCTDTDTIIFYSQTYSYRMFEQAKGRIDRLNTPFTDLYYYVLSSPSGIDNGIRKCLRSKKSFNEQSWLRSASGS